MKTKIHSLLLLVVVSIVAVQPLLHAADKDGLANTTVLVIRHGEKDGVSPANILDQRGQERAGAYAAYFAPTGTVTPPPIAPKPNSIFATADSTGSSRPRLTVTPLATSIGLTVQTSIKDKNGAAVELVDDAVKDLAKYLKENPCGPVIVICWHHGKIPKLLKDLGADPSKLIKPDPKNPTHPDGLVRWPDDVFNWVIKLTYDKDGNLATQEAINENLLFGDEKWPVISQ